MDYIYTELDPSAIDLSKTLIFHNFKELPEPREELYKRVAFVTTSDNLDQLNDSMYICLLEEGEYTWVNAFSTGISDRAIEVLKEKIIELYNIKADAEEVVESFNEVKELIDQKADTDDVVEDIEEIREIQKPFIVDIERKETTLELNKTWKEIKDAYMDGRTVLCKYWTVWDSDAGFFPPRAIYPMTGIGMRSPTEYVCYTGDGIFTAKSENDYPIIDNYGTADGELVPIKLVCSREDRVLSVDEAITITAVADFGGDYTIIWECNPGVGELSDFVYMKDGKSLTITPRQKVLKLDYNPTIGVTAKIKNVPSICNTITLVAERKMLNAGEIQDNGILE